MRTAALVLAGVGLAFASLPALAQSTTRIETRPVYGAIVNVEEGVRVFRPLPPHDRIIINPDGKTPLSLTVQQSTDYTYSRNYIYNVADETGPESRAAAGAYLRNRHIRRIAPQRPVSGIK
jgi:hypothetical protein